MLFSKQKKKIAILGGGMASLTAAFELSNQPDWQEKYEITIYQMGWRLGGKGASGRNLNSHGRIEEHGLHVFMGIYENTFATMRQCYQELGRSSDCPLATWQDAFKPHSFVVLPEQIGSQWFPWYYDFSPNNLLPGDGHEFPTIMGYVSRIIEFTIEHLKSSSYLSSGLFAEEYLSLSEELPDWLTSVLEEMKISSEDSSLQLPQEVACLYIAHQLVAVLPPDPCRHQAGQHQAIIWLFGQFRNWLLATLEGIAEIHHKFRRLSIVVDLAYTVIRGIIADGIIFEGFDIIDEYDFQEWLTKHGALKSSVNSVPIRGIYDLVFGYENGNVNQPNLAAGGALRSFLRLLFTYRGSFFWKMQAGMGDTIFAPLYEILKKRGIIFKFFHKVKNLGLGEDRKTVATIEIGRQATLKNQEYEPLINIKGLPCWASTPLYEQLVEGEILQAKQINLESAWNSWQDVEQITLKAGEDFDLVVLGISLGALKYICPELIAARKEWQLMVEKVKTVQTQALQVWLKPELAQLGWSMPSPILDGYVHPLNTWADMSHLNQAEDWSLEYFPGNIAYFCGPLEDREEIPPFADDQFPVQEHERVRKIARQWFEQNISDLWPKITNNQTSNPVDWELLIDPQERKGSERFKAQFWRANIEPSDRYVLSVKGSTKYRLKPDRSGFENLYLVGDWTRNGFNLACIEATVISGMQVSRSISGYPTKIVGESDIGR